MENPKTHSRCFFQSAFPILLNEERVEIMHSDSIDIHTEKAYAMGNVSCDRRFDKKCHYCGRIGHIERFCYKKKTNMQEKDTKVTANHVEDAKSKVQDASASGFCVL